MAKLTDAEQMRRWRAANPEKAKAASRRAVAAQRQWRLDHPTERKAVDWRKGIAKRGLTVPEYEAKLAAQGGRCAICWSDCPGGKGRWHIDHDHQTGQVRGLLCSRCNLLLGHGRDNPDLLRLAADYLEGLV